MSDYELNKLPHFCLIDYIRFELKPTVYNATAPIHKEKNIKTGRD